MKKNNCLFKKYHAGRSSQTDRKPPFFQGLSEMMRYVNQLFPEVPNAFSLLVPSFCAINLKLLLAKCL